MRRGINTEDSDEHTLAPREPDSLPRFDDPTTYQHRIRVNLACSSLGATIQRLVDTMPTNCD